MSEPEIIEGVFSVKPGSDLSAHLVRAKRSPKENAKLTAQANRALFLMRLGDIALLVAIVFSVNMIDILATNWIY